MGKGRWMGLVRGGFELFKLLYWFCLARPVNGSLLQTAFANKMGYLHLVQTNTLNHTLQNIILRKQQVEAQHCSALHIFVHFKLKNQKLFWLYKYMYLGLTNCWLKSTYMEEDDVLVWWKAQRERFSGHGENLWYETCASWIVFFSQDSRQRMFTSRVIWLSLAVPHAHTLR